jgi:solute carrier family 8 (sodium/calcium exchanger)
MGFTCKFEGMMLPIFGGEQDWPNAIRVILYLMGLGWIFLGVGIVSDVFMNGIEKITSAKKRVFDKSTNKFMTVYVWNDTVANLTLMALGSSAPEILLSLIEVASDDFFLGPLGAGTIVGSAAFNLLVISAVCVLAIPDGEVRFIQQVPVYMCTASCSVFAYVWLFFILVVSSPDVCEIWEAVTTLLFMPILVVVAYLADRGYLDFSKDHKYTPDADHHDLAIADDVSDEELLEIQASIRAEHGEELSDDQVAKIMRLQYCSKHSRAYYRHVAMEASLHGKKVDKTAQPDARYSIREVLTTSDAIDEDKKAKTCLLGWESCKYGYREDCGKAKVVITRHGPTDCKVSVRYTTKEGAAKAGSDYEHVEGVATFEKGELEKPIFIEIKDDTTFENDEDFDVVLSDPKAEDASGFFAKLSQYHTTKVTIIDDDQPGELRFLSETLTVNDGAGEQIVEVEVSRYNGSTGNISCAYKTENMTAVAGHDYEQTEGKLEFEDGQAHAKIVVKILPQARNKEITFNLVISDAEGTKFDPKTDGGEDTCVCHVVVPAGQDKGGVITAMRDRIHSANAIMGHKNWAQQFRDALFEIGDGDEDEDGAEASGPSKLDIFIHIISIPWKLIFAFVPPVDYCGGWACFTGALIMIGGVTALVSDMANLVGCCFDVLPETAAITFVALGTSLPDTFASKTAAMMDPYADASIGNVTGSNSVNVFLGVGLAWTVAAIYWQTNDDIESEAMKQWTKRLYHQVQMNTPTPGYHWYDPTKEIGKPLKDSTLFDNVKKITTDGNTFKNGIFVTPGGSIYLNLAVFVVNAFCAIQHLFARRKKFGGELGGPKKGFFGQYFSGAFLGFQWFIYVTVSIIFARTGGKSLSYTDLAEQSAWLDKY